MKRLFAIIFAAAVILGAFAALPAFADEMHDYQPFEDKTLIRTEKDFVDLPNSTLPLDESTRLKIAEDYKSFCNYNSDPAACKVFYYKTLSNGMMLVFVEPEDTGYAAVKCADIIGKYAYVRGAGGMTVKLYKDGEFTEIVDAYKSGAIDDALLDEINEVMKFDTYTLKYDPATPDNAATPEIPYTGGGISASDDNAGGFIATGDNGALFAVCAALAIAAPGAFIIFRKKEQ